MSDTGGRPGRDLRQDQLLLREIDLLSRGEQLPRAVEMARDAVRGGLEHPLLLNLLAYGLQEESRFDEAVSYWDRALKLDPNHPSLLTAKANCLSIARRHEEAVAAYERALAVEPRNPRAWGGLGHSHLNVGDHDRAKAAFSKAIGLDPREAEAWAGLGNIAVREGDLELASEIAARASAADPAHARVLLLHAEIALGRRNFDEAERWSREAAVAPQVSAMDRSVALIRLGDALHEQARFSEAFAAYSEGKGISAAYYAPEFRKPGVETPPERAERLFSYFQTHDPAPWRRPAGGGDRTDILGHAFLLGFARSGTTLLENILTSRSDVVALEERPTLLDGESKFLASTDGLNRLASLNEYDARMYRVLYWRQAAKYLPDVRGKFVLDKFPLATPSLPLIAKLFPKATVLFAVRDPRDVVLSCFRRAFGINTGMYEFTSFEGTARYYDAVMRVAETYLKVLPLKVREVRHEKLVTDFDEEMQAVCAHVGLDWTTEMRDFAEKVRGKVIRTPSANQVRRGLNTDGFAQWRPYAAEMEALAPWLDRWVKAFGYADQ